MIYTGYFSHQTKYISAGLVPISVAQYIPKKIADSGIIEYKRLAPSRDMMELAKNIRAIQIWKFNFSIKIK